MVVYVIDFGGMIMTEEIIAKLKRFNIGSVSDKEIIKKSTDLVYYAIWNNAIYDFNINGLTEIVHFYTIVDANDKRISRKENEKYFDTLRSESRKQQLFIKYSNLCEKERKVYILPVLVNQLLDNLESDGFYMFAEAFSDDLVVCMDTKTLEDLVSKAILGELNCKVRKK